VHDRLAFTRPSNENACNSPEYLTAGAACNDSFKLCTGKPLEAPLSFSEAAMTEGLAKNGALERQDNRHGRLYPAKAGDLCLSRIVPSG
jgi:hypothetical protein